MAATTLEELTEIVELSEQLQAGRATMLEPQDLPGRFARAVRGVDRILQRMQCEAVLGGGWAVWRHGYTARVTQDLDVALPADRIEEFLRVAAVSGFEILPEKPGRWPKVRHKDSDTKVDILPEGARPGIASKPAPTTIPHPRAMGAKPGRLLYMELLSLVELKLGAGRAKDDVDVIELIRANLDQIDIMRQHLEKVHVDYVSAFDRLLEAAREPDDR